MDRWISQHQRDDRPTNWICGVTLYLNHLGTLDGYGPTLMLPIPEV